MEPILIIISMIVIGFAMLFVMIGISMSTPIPKVILGFFMYVGLLLIISGLILGFGLSIWKSIEMVIA